LPFRTSLQATYAANYSWAKTTDRTARTEKARAAALANLEKTVDPDGLMSAGDRKKAAENLRKARLQAAAQRSADKRRGRKRSEADRAAMRAGIARKKAAEKAAQREAAP
jgi:hypothetical protein